MKISSLTKGFNFCLVGWRSSLWKLLGEGVDLFMGGKTILGFASMSLSSLTTKSSSICPGVFIGGSLVNGFFLHAVEASWQDLLGTGETSAAQYLFRKVSFIYIGDL